MTWDERGSLRYSSKCKDQNNPDKTPDAPTAARTNDPPSSPYFRQFQENQPWRDETKIQAKRIRHQINELIDLIWSKQSKLHKAARETKETNQQLLSWINHQPRLRNIKKRQQMEKDRRKFREDQKALMKKNFDLREKLKYQVAINTRIEYNLRKVMEQKESQFKSQTFTPGSQKKQVYSKAPLFNQHYSILKERESLKKTEDKGNVFTPKWKCSHDAA